MMMEASSPLSSEGQLPTKEEGAGETLTAAHAASDQEPGTSSKSSSSSSKSAARRRKKKGTAAAGGGGAAPGGTPTAADASSSTSTAKPQRTPTHQPKMSGKAAARQAAKVPAEVNGIRYDTYKDETQMQAIMDLFAKDLSEPYSIYTYRYFINNWPRLCVLAFDAETNRMVGSIVCKLDNHRGSYRGYIAMLAVEDGYRKRGIGSQLVTRAINTMKEEGCDEVVLETEVTNKGSLALYERLGFIKDKRLCRYYLNGVDAFRLKIFFIKEPLFPPAEQ